MKSIEISGNSSHYIRGNTYVLERLLTAAFNADHRALPRLDVTNNGSFSAKTKDGEVPLMLSVTKFEDGLARAFEDMRNKGAIMPGQPAMPVGLYKKAEGKYVIAVPGDAFGARALA